LQKHTPKAKLGTSISISNHPLPPIQPAKRKARANKHFQKIRLPKQTRRKAQPEASRSPAQLLIRSIFRKMDYRHLYQAI
jgi:hypothetical protein